MLVAALIGIANSLGSVELIQDNGSGNLAVNTDGGQFCVHRGDGNGETVCVKDTLSHASDVLNQRVQLRNEDAANTADFLSSRPQVYQDRLAEALSAMTTMSENLLAEVSLNEKLSAFDTSATLGATGIENSLSSELEKIQNLAGPKISAFKQNAMDDMGEVEGDINAMISDIQGTIPGDANDLNNKVTSELNAAKSKQDEITQIANQLEATFNAQVKKAEDSVKQFQTAAQAEIDNAVKSLMPSARKMWSGGCHYSEQGSWRNYCLDRTDYNTYKQDDGSAGFSIVSGYRWRNQIKGVLRIRHWHWTHSSMGYMHIYIYNHHRFDGRSRRPVAGHWCHRPKWHDMHGDINWRVESGHDIWVRMGRTCGSWTFHSWSSSGTHSRLQIEYLGTWD